MGLRLFFLPTFPGAMFIQGGTFIPDYRIEKPLNLWEDPVFSIYLSSS